MLREKHKRINVHFLLTVLLDKLTSLRLKFFYERREVMTLTLIGLLCGINE